MHNKFSHPNNVINDITYRHLNKNDLPSICDLLTLTKTPIGGLYTKGIYRAISKMALEDDRLIFIVAQKNSKLVGLTLSIINRWSFWKSFLPRHPLISSQIFSKKLIERFKEKLDKENYEPELLELIDDWIQSSPPFSEGEKDPNKIAHTAYTAVSPGNRKERIGVNLQNHRDQILCSTTDSLSSYST